MLSTLKVLQDIEHFRGPPQGLKQVSKRQLPVVTKFILTTLPESQLQLGEQELTD